MLQIKGQNDALDAISDKPKIKYSSKRNKFYVSSSRNLRSQENLLSRRNQNNAPLYNYSETKAYILRKEVGDLKRETMASSYLLSQMESHDTKITTNASIPNIKTPTDYYMP